MSETTSVPIQPPAPATEKDPRADIDEKQQELYDGVLSHFSKTDYTLPDVEDGTLLEDEKIWLSRECFLRYLRAVKWKSSEAAIERLEATLKWRREYGLYTTVTAAHVEPEAVTGKEILFGYDKQGRPAFYMFPSRQNTEEATRQIQFAVWMLERGLDLAAPGVETLDLLINYGDKSKNTPFSTARTVLSILQDHYPERLGQALIVNVPWLLNAFFKMISPFIDPVTREKMKFNPDLVKDGLFDANMVMTEWGGDQKFEYDHEKYWPALVETCEKRRRSWKEKWRSMGATVGLKEWEFKREDVAEKVSEPNGEVKEAQVDVKEIQVEVNGNGVAAQ